MRKRALRNRNDIRTAATVTALGLLVWVVTGEWRWLITGALAGAAAAAVLWILQRRGGWGPVVGVLALLAGLVMWLWAGDGRWAVLGVFPLVFVLISRMATALENRR